MNRKFVYMAAFQAKIKQNERKKINRVNKLI